MSTREKVDKFISKWISRKLTVFAVASYGLFSGVLTSSDWVIIATAYVALEGFADIVVRVKSSNN